MLDDADEISRENFIKLATETKLTDFPVDRELSSRIGLAKAQEEDADRTVKKIYTFFSPTNHLISTNPPTNLYFTLLAFSPPDSSSTMSLL